MNRPGTALGSVPLFRKGGKYVPGRVSRVCPRGEKCPNKDTSCRLSHKPSHLKEVDKRLKKKGKGRGRGKGKGKGKRKGKTGAVLDEADDEGEGDDYIPYYEIEVDDKDEPVVDSDE